MDLGLFGRLSPEIPPSDRGGTIPMGFLDLYWDSQCHGRMVGHLVIRGELGHVEWKKNGISSTMFFVSEVDTSRTCAISTFAISNNIMGYPLFQDV